MLVERASKKENAHSKNVLPEKSSSGSQRNVEPFALTSRALGLKDLYASSDFEASQGRLIEGIAERILDRMEFADEELSKALATSKKQEARRMEKYRS